MKKSNGTVEQSTKAVVVKIEFNLTEKEIIFLKTMSESDFWENDIDSIVWDYSVNDFLPYKGKTRSGVISSLEQKGVINVTKKEKGDIAGTYHLTDEAKINEQVISIVTRQEVQQEPTLQEVTEEEFDNTIKDVTVILNGTWKDGIEAKSFEGAVLNILKEKFNCKVVQVKSSTSNDFEVTGTREDIDILSAAFNELVRGIRVSTKEAYKASDKTLSQFKFTTNYHIELLKTLDLNLVENPTTLK